MLCGDDGLRIDRVIHGALARSSIAIGDWGQRTDRDNGTIRVNDHALPIALTLLATVTMRCLLLAYRRCFNPYHLCEIELDHPLAVRPYDSR